MAEGIRRRKGKKGTSYEVFVYSAREGRKIRKTFPTLAQARNWRIENLRGLNGDHEPAASPNGGRVTPEASKTVSQIAAEFVEGMKTGAVRDRNERPYKPSTIRSYERALNLGVLPLIGGSRLADVTVQDVRAVVRKLRGKGLSDSTVRNRLDPLRAIFRWAVDEQLVDFNPTAGLRLPNGRKERAPSRSFGEVADLIDALRPGDQALWATAFYAGLRRGELRALRVSDLDFEAGEIWVARSWDEKAGPVEPKTRAGVRTVPMLGALRSYLTDHLIAVERGGDDLVFGRSAQDPFVPSSVGNRAKTDWKRAGLEGLTLHEARHLFASFAIASGVRDTLIIAEAMGHSSPTTTVEIYGHLLPGREDELREAMDAFVVAPGG